MIKMKIDLGLELPIVPSWVSWKIDLQVLVTQ
jgi:hypothetical protein